MVMGLAVGDSEPTRTEAALAVWLVSYGDTDDRELRLPQIAEALRRGDIGEETIVWREGLPEWIPLGTVPELAQFLPATGLTSGAPAKPLSLKPPLPVKAGQTPVPDAAPRAEPAAADAAPESVEPESLEPESAPAAEFSTAQALSVGTLSSPKRRSVPAPPPAPKREPAPPPPEEEEEAAPSSGTPSLLALAAPAHASARPIDEDILQLGGRLPDALGPPTIDLLTSAPPESVRSSPAASVRDTRPTSPPRGGAAPVESSAPASRSAPAPRTKKRSMLPWLALAALAGAIPAYALRGSGPSSPVAKADGPGSVQGIAPEPAKPPEPAPGIAESAAATPPSAVPSAAPAPLAPASAAATAAVAQQAPAPSPVPAAPPATAPVATAPGQKPTTPVVKSEATAGTAQVASAKAPATAESKAAATPGEPAAPAPAEGEPAGPPFDVGAAQASLAAAAAQAAGCRKEGDPTGSASVRITFSNAGAAARATIEGPPFAGTETGSCIAAAMKTAKVPAYSGDRVSVLKHIVIQ